MTTAEKKAYPPVPKEVRNPDFAARLKKYGVPAWPCAPVYDRCFVFQIPTFEAETISPGGLIVPAEQTKTRDQSTAPRGVLLAAGLGALDHLLSHDIRIGDIVYFARFANWAVPIMCPGGVVKKICFLRSSEIVGSEDQVERLRSGEVTMETDEEGTWQFTGRKRVDLVGSSDEM